MRRIDELTRDEQEILIGVGCRACALGMSIHPTELREALATLRLDAERLDLAALAAKGDAAFKGDAVAAHARATVLSPAEAKR